MFQKLGFGEIALIVGIALLVFGPAKLPQLGKSVGEGIREFKKSVKSLSGDITDTAQEIKTEVAKVQNP